MDHFELIAPYSSTGDQPEAIAKLTEGVENGLQEQVLLGVTGSGKTFTMANVIANVNRPTLVLAHNKTLAAQLCSEFREFFPNNAVEYFVSYYDYYQPEAYVPGKDVYIEKDSAVNAEIDKLRHSATSALFERRDVIIVASVSCIFSLGDPEEYREQVLSLRPGMHFPREQLIKRLVGMQYSRSDIGFDRSFIASYGHDDRVCAYAELAGIFDAKSPKRTAVCIFADKEEIGSEGVSGMLSQAFDKFMADLCEAQGVALRDCLANSFCLSADVTAAYDPNFADVYDKRNAAFVNYGVGLCKYTGAGGKSGASDASAEVVGRVRKLLNDNGVFWQMAELGKTDAGGGGTVAKFMAQRNIDTLDAGVPVLSMHAPYETVAKLDCYMTYKTMRVIFEQN